MTKFCGWGVRRASIRLAIICGLHLKCLVILIPFSFALIFWCLNVEYCVIFFFLISYLSFVFGLRDGFKNTLPITENTSIDPFHKYKMRRIREKLISLPHLRLQPAFQPQHNAWPKLQQSLHPFLRFG